MHPSPTNTQLSPRCITFEGRTNKGYQKIITDLSYELAANAPSCRNRGCISLFQFKLKIGENEEAFKVLWSVKELRKPSGVQTASGKITCLGKTNLDSCRMNERQSVF